MGSLKQRFNEQEQQPLVNQVKVAGMIYEESENGLNTAIEIAYLLKNTHRIKAVKLIPPINDKNDGR